jgi:membrane-associated protein
MLYSAVGGLLWAVGVTMAGYYLGNIAFVRDHIELILIGVIVISVIPMIIEYVRHRRSRTA